MANSHDGDLIRKDRTYEDSITATIIEQYKMYVQTADNVSARRVSTGRHLLTLSAALIAVYGFQSSLLDHWYLPALISATGVAVSLLWYRIIKSHRDLNATKFQLIHKLEQCLPAALFTQEWHMTERNASKSYTRITDIERWIPFLFIALHASLFVGLHASLFIDVLQSILQFVL